MKRLLLASIAVLIAACGRPVDTFRSAVPTADSVRMNVPAQSTGQGLSGSTQTTQQGLQGETADFYKVTLGVTTLVNGSTLLVLGLVKTIVDHEPTSLSATEAVWGPHTEPLRPTTWKLTVKSQGNGDYTYELEGKPKTAADSAYVTVLSGSHHRVSDRYGNGTFLLDWDAAKALPDHDGKSGSAVFTYSKLSAAAEGKIDVDFTGVKESDGTAVDAKYRYSATPGQGGTFAFSAQANVGGSAAPEALLINSRWLETGAGRADVKVTGGDIGAGATASECWNENFDSRYLNLSYAPASGYGTEATDCSFQTAVFASL